MKEIREVKRILSQVKSEFNQIKKLSQQRIIFFSRAKIGHQIKENAEMLKEQITTLINYKKEYLSEAKEKNNADILRKHILTIINYQREVSRINDEVSLLNKITENSIRIKQIIETSISELSQISNGLGEVIERGRSTDQRIIAQKSQKMILEFISGLETFKTLNDSYLSTYHPINEEVLKGYERLLLKQQEKITQYDLIRVADDIEKDIKAELFVLNALIIYEDNKVALEQILMHCENKIEALGGSTYGKMAMKLFPRAGLAALACSILMAMTPVPGQTTKSNGIKEPPKKSWQDIQSAAKVAKEQICVNYASYILGKKASAPMYDREASDFEIFSKMNIDGLLDIALYGIAHETNKNGYWKLFADCDNVAEQYPDPLKAQYYYAKAILCTKINVKYLLGGLPKIQGASILEPGKWLENGFVKLPIKWSSDYVNWNVLRYEEMDENMFTKYACKAASLDPQYAMKIVLQMETDGYVYGLGNLARKLAQTCKASGHYEMAYKMYIASAKYNSSKYYADLGLLPQFSRFMNYCPVSQDDFVDMAECASHFDGELVYNTGMLFIQTFGPDDGNEKSISSEIGDFFKTATNKVRNALWVAFKADIRVRNGKVKVLGTPPAQTVNKKRVDRYYENLFTISGKISEMGSSEKGFELMRYANTMYGKNEYFASKLKNFL